MPSAQEGAGEKDPLLAETPSARSAHGLFKNGEPQVKRRIAPGVMADDFEAWLAQPTKQTASASDAITEAGLNWGTWSDAIIADARKAKTIWYYEPLTECQKEQLLTLIKQWDGQREETQFQTLHELDDRRLLVTLANTWLPSLLEKTDLINPFFKTLTATVRSHEALRDLLKEKEDGIETLEKTWSDFTRIAEDAKLDPARLLHYQLLQSLKYVDTILHQARHDQYNMIADLLAEMYDSEEYIREDTFPDYFEIAPCDPAYVVPSAVKSKALLSEMQMIGHTLNLCAQYAAIGKTDTLALNDEMKLLLDLYVLSKQDGDVPSKRYLSHLITAHYLATQSRKMIGELADWDRVIHNADLSQWPSNTKDVLKNLMVLIIKRSWRHLKNEQSTLTGRAIDALTQWLGIAIKGNIEFIAPSTNALHPDSIWRQIKDQYAWPYRESTPTTELDGHGNATTKC